MNKRLPLVAGVALVVLACVGGYFAFRPSDTATTDANSPVTTAPAAPGLTSVNCIGGSEKSDLMADPDVQQKLRDKGLDVKFTQMGSFEMVALPTEELDKQGINCLWPASASALSVYTGSHPKPYNTATALKTPEVIYAGPAGTQALIDAKIVEQRGDQYYVVNLKALLLDYILAGKSWNIDLPQAGLLGPFRLSSTDPAKSNSGLTLSQLELTILSTDDVNTPPSEVQAHKGLAAVRQLYDAQGYQDATSADGFNTWLQDGGERRSPLYASYESLALQTWAKYKDNPSVRDQLKAKVRILYPEPTIYNDNPIIARDAAAQKFIDAILSDDIQQIAWSKYGLRSGTTIGANNVADYADLHIAQDLSNTSPPNGKVTTLLLACLQQNVCN